MGQMWAGSAYKTRKKNKKNVPTEMHIRPGKKSFTPHRHNPATDFLMILCRLSGHLSYPRYTYDHYMTTPA